MKRIPELLDTGIYEIFITEKSIKLYDFLNELNLNLDLVEFYGILVNGVKITDLDIILTEFDKVVIIPEIRGSSPISRKGLDAYYTVREFTNDLLNELSKYPEALYRLNPKRVEGKYGYTMSDLSILWKHHKNYVAENRRRHKKDPNFIFSKESLSSLKNIIKQKYGIKGIKCINLIDEHQNRNLNLELFIKLILEELGKISSEISVKRYELAMLLDISQGHLNNIRENSKFKLSLERLKILKHNLQILLKGLYSETLFEKIIDNYIKKNPNLPKDSFQRHTINRPNFFNDIYNNLDISYWFGYLCADGYGNKENYKISFSQRLRDADRVAFFADSMGFDHNRIYYGNHIHYDESGNLRIDKYSEAQFYCKEMIRDLDRLGFFQFKHDGELPDIVKLFITKAKREVSKNPSLRLSDIYEGRIALTFLLGFFDGDGTHRGGMSAKITNTKKTFLDQIVQYFECKNKVSLSYEEVIDDETGEIVRKRVWELYLGAELFQELLLSYDNSMVRKRPENFR